MFRWIGVMYIADKLISKVRLCPGIPKCIKGGCPGYFYVNSTQSGVIWEEGKLNKENISV